MKPDPRPALVLPSNGTVHHAFGECLTVKLGGAQTSGAFALCENITPPGGGPPPHFHLHEDELFILQEGRVSFLLKGQWTDLGPGAVVFIPRGEVHTFRNAGDGPAKQWILTTPAGFEIFFGRCAAEFAKPGGPDMTRVKEIGVEHGIHFVEGARATEHIP